MSSNEHARAPQDYPLPVVDALAVRDVMAFMTEGRNPEEGVQMAFTFLQAHNSEVAMEVGEMLKFSGYGSPDCVEAARLSVAMTHMLLHAQARINKGLPGVDLSDGTYHLPVVTEDTVSAFFAGVDERLGAAGRGTYDDLEAHNAWIPRTLGLLDLRIGDGTLGSPPSQAAEIAAITVHGMLREQAEVDALNGQWGGGPPRLDC